tara:strand:- start:4326 stop:5078 length:753 start_codon:yes stop_codon:yes gene_type:complete
MAINVNTVYKTVLLILNKEQRGYMTPDEFNRVASQVQLEIFERYFDDLNQQLRIPQTDTDYSDRQMNIDEKIAIFKTFGKCAYTESLRSFALPTIDFYGQTPEFYRLGAVVYRDETELQRLQRSDFYNIQKSPLTKSTISFPTYLYENQRLFIKPDSIKQDVTADYVRKPLDVRWGYEPGTLGQYQYTGDDSIYDPAANPNGSTQFELHISEQSSVVIDILMYAGIIIRDPQIVQAAAQEAVMNEQNSKM